MLLVNKEAALGLLWYRIGQGRNSKEIEEERVGKVREKPCSRRRRQMPELYPISHSDVAIQMNRNGLRYMS